MPLPVNWTHTATNIPEAADAATDAVILPCHRHYVHVRVRSSLFYGGNSRSGCATTCSWHTAPWLRFGQGSRLYLPLFRPGQSNSDRPCMHLGTYVLHPYSHWGWGPVSATDSVNHCDPRCRHRSKNTTILGASSVCWIMQVWRHVSGRLGYRPDDGSMCWGYVPKIAAADCCGSRHCCLFFCHFFVW